VLKRCFPDKFPKWEKKIHTMIPHYGPLLNTDAKKAKASLAATAKSLGLTA
jgi:malate dehydrogenase (quinone)